MYQWWTLQTFSSQFNLAHVISSDCSLLSCTEFLYFFFFIESEVIKFSSLFKLRWRIRLLTTVQECVSSCSNTEDKTPSSGMAGLECESLGAMSLLRCKRMGSKVKHTDTHEEQKRDKRRRATFMWSNIKEFINLHIWGRNTQLCILKGNLLW